MCGLVFLITVWPSFKAELKETQRKKPYHLVMFIWLRLSQSPM